MSNIWTVFLQINTAKYNVDREITNIYENLQIVWSHFSLILYYSLIFGLLRISIGLSVFGFVANEYKWITICSLSNIHNIRSGIRWAITKGILNYSMLPINDLRWSLLNFVRKYFINWAVLTQHKHCLNKAKISGQSKQAGGRFLFIWLMST